MKLKLENITKELAIEKEKKKLEPSQVKGDNKNADVQTCKCKNSTINTRTLFFL